MRTLAVELAEALERMVDATCPSMRALWLSGTARVRRELRGGSSVSAVAGVPAPYANWKKSRRSKYEALAEFRHSVVWRLPHDRWHSSSPAGRKYFAPCEDTPPFCEPGDDARSQQGKEEHERVSTQLAQLLNALKAEIEREEGGSRSPNEVFVASTLLRRATRRTLQDVLKLDADRFDALFDDHPRSGR